MITNASQSELHQALDKINEKYEGNIFFNTILNKEKRVSFTLAAVSGKYGSRNSASGRKMPKASWHAHGDFFDALFEINPDCFVRSQGKKITKDAGNWEEIKTGSFYSPSYMSDHSN